MSNFGFTPLSHNGKTGPIPVTNSPRDTCPPSCPLSGKKGGCYGEGYRTGLHWDHLDRGTRGDDWPTFIAKIRTIRPDRLWRHNAVGDLPGANDRLNGSKVAQLTAANKGRKGFTFCHYPIEGKHGAHNRAQLQKANDAGFTVNSSQNTIAEAVRTFKEYGLPTVALVPVGFWKDKPNSIFVDGVRVVRCVAEHSEQQCIDCGICQKKDRGYIIAFEAHGNQKGAADIIARAV